MARLLAAAICAVSVFRLCAVEVLNVREFGAKGDGTTKDTEAIQKALDACAGKSGRVVVPPGTYLTGSLYVGDDTELHLEEGAVILGSPDLADYNAPDAYPQNHGSVKEGWSAKHLILVLEKKNVKITGKGTIDGNGRAFFADKIAYRHHVCWRHGGRNAKGKPAEQLRPGQEIVFIESSNVEVRDVTFRDMSCWSCFFHGCENVAVGGVTVRNGFHNLNTDGIDIDCCRNVDIGDCDIVTGDDAIAIRGNPARLKDKTKVCENVRVSNIVCRVQADGVRVGVGHGTIRNVRISDMKIKESGRALHVQCCYGSPKGGGKTGVDISNVHFERIEIDGTCEPVCVTAGSEKSTAHLKDISFRDIRAESALPPSVTGMGKTRPDGISFRDCSFTVGKSIPGARIGDDCTIPMDGGSAQYAVKNAGNVTFDGCILEIDEDARLGADCVKNGSFEMRGGNQAWTLPEGWSISRGFGRNGSGALVFESAEKRTETVYAEQIVDVIPGKIYDFEAWSDGNMEVTKGLSYSIIFLDAEGKMVGSAYPGAAKCGNGWKRLWVRTKRLPPAARTVRIRTLVPAGGAGKVYFDDISFRLHTVKPITAFCSSRYRNEVETGGGKVGLFAGIDLADCGCGKDDVEVTFAFDAADGKRVGRKAARFDGTDASVEIDADELKMGEQDVSVELKKKDGTSVGSKTMKFRRLAERPGYPVSIDPKGRVMVGGKPFFPIAVYCTRAESNIIERIGKTPFNTVMAYHKVNLPMLDWCRKHGLMAMAHAGDLSSYDVSMTRFASRLKDHPALLAWLVNDERPLTMYPQIMSRYRAVVEGDPGHPAWAVLYQVDQMRSYVGTCDAIGSDPYPIPFADIKLAHDWVEKTRKASFGAVSLWQTVQIFDWAAYKTKGVPGTDVSKYRAPTLAEMKIMSWLQIAGGANALLMYSYNPLMKMDWRDPFEKKWAEVCECAGEIAAVTDAILSVETPPELGKIPETLSVRAWRTGKTVHLLVCNATAKALKTSFGLGGGEFGRMRTVFGGGAKRDGDRLSVDFAPEGYAFLAFE